MKLSVLLRLWRGSIRLVKRSPNDRIRAKVDSEKPNIKTTGRTNKKNSRSHTKNIINKLIIKIFFNNKGDKMAKRRKKAAKKKTKKKAKKRRRR